MSKIVSPYKNIKQHTRISLEPYYMNSDIRNNMKLVLKKKVEKKCNKNGFIDEVYKILEFNDGILIPENLNSAAIYNIAYHCRICIPIENTTIISYIKLISTDLIIAVNGSDIELKAYFTDKFNTTHRIRETFFTSANFEKVEFNELLLT
jgi:hypothetical protein